jgi:polyhydroxyalkanoate synthesis repressor PhaR
MAKPVTIQKFPNRRLHDPATGTDLTLEELAEMLDEGEDFTVQDARTGADITGTVIAQIVFQRNNESPATAFRRGTEKMLRNKKLPPN